MKRLVLGVVVGFLFSTAALAWGLGYQLSGLLKTAQPACTVAANRGIIWTEYGGDGVADRVQVCLKDASNQAHWHEIPVLP